MKAIILIVAMAAIIFVGASSQPAMATETCTTDFNVYGKQYCPSNIKIQKKWWDFLIPNKRMLQSWANQRKALEQDYLMRSPSNRESDLTAMMRTFF
jgi:hypothetical protein